MQTVITYLTLLLTGIVLQAQNTIEVSISGFENNNGKALVALYDSEAHFLEKSFKRTLSSISDKKAIVSFSEVPDGTYAISSFHDEDDNGKLNMIMGFIPSEATGTSNDAPARFGPPTWEDAKFEVKAGKALNLNIKMN